MGCLISLCDQPYGPTNAVPVSEVDCDAPLQPDFINEDDDQTKLINRPAPIISNDSPDTSDVDQEMIQKLLEKVELSDD